MPEPVAFETAFRVVGELVERFRANEARYLTSDYQEAAVRKDFIDKFWIALGWDVNHDAQTNPYEQEVKVEPPVSMGGSQRRADYSFHLAPNYRDPKFYVEAKKPAGDLGTAENYFQSIRYGWNSQTPVAVLTDFEQFQIVDCRYKPDVETAKGRVLEKFHYSDYANKEKFARIYWFFSREALESGSFERRIAELPKGKLGRLARREGIKAFDESFLADLSDFRLELAKAFRKEDKELDGFALTELAQRTLDRLVFMRFLEDTEIENGRLVDEFAESEDGWTHFVSSSRRLDGIYNGLIFRQHDILDAPGFSPNQKAFAAICRSLGSKRSPYAFNFIPIHTLGSIYERFLGEVIVATGAKVSLEQKVEVRKAGGVYYTPEYVVRHIIEKTVGELVAGKTPSEIDSMKFADIACGSGSFLLSIYDYLLQYEGLYYNANPEKVRPGDCITREGKLYLSLHRKREILLKNIFGVDVDPQAVEVAQLSLCLRLLKDETPYTARQYQLEFLQGARVQRILPDLSRNVVSGNSVVEPDILQQTLFTGDAERRLNPISLIEVFPTVLKGKTGGFDAIVGNPPYIRIQTLQETTPQAIEYLSRKYLSARKGSYDLYVVFVERALSLLKSPSGRMGYILPHKFFNSQYGESLRALLAAGAHVQCVVHFGHNQVFEGATTYTCLLFLAKGRAETFEFNRVDDLLQWQASGAAATRVLPAKTLGPGEWNIAVGRDAELFERLNGLQTKLGDVADIFVGLQTSADDVFIMDLVEERRQLLTLRSKALGSETVIEREVLHPVVSGADVSRYGRLPKRQWMLFPYEVVDERVRLMPIDEIEKRFPRAAAYLIENRGRLAKREKGKFDDANWHRFGRSQNLGIQGRAKVCVPRLVQSLHAAWDADGACFLDNVDVGGLTLKTGQSHYSQAYLLALLNSRLMRWFFPFVAATFRAGYLSANRQFLSQLPFRSWQASDADENEKHDRVVALVRTRLELEERMRQTKTDGDRARVMNQVSVAERELDDIIYALYALDDNDVLLVEGITA